MSYKREIRRTISLLSVLLVASTASIRVSLAASAPTPSPTPEPSQAVAILSEACTGANTIYGDSAAYAAEMLRWEAGYISRTSKNTAISKNNLVYEVFSAASRLMKTQMQPNWQAWNLSLIHI